MKQLINYLHAGAFSARIRLPQTVKLISRKGGVPVEFLRSLLVRALLIMTGSKANLIRVIHRFISTIVKMVKNHGAPSTVKWLKACHVSLMRYIGKNPVSTLREVEPELPLMRTINGLPSVIPKSHRNAIRAYKCGNRETGGVFYTRFWLTLFGIYRILSIPGIVKYKTITDPPTFTPEWLDIDKFLPTFVKWLTVYAPELERSRPIDVSASDPLAGGSAKSGPNATNQWIGLDLDAVAWMRAAPEWYRTVFRQYCIITGSFPLVHWKHKTAQAWLKRNRFGHATMPKDPLKGESFNSISDFRLGRLAAKNEAAGKVRLFAITDGWTQAAFKPLHEFLFAILKRIPSDGTFDQDACLERISKSAESAWSYDLSSATDRLPVFLQARLLNHLIPHFKLPGRLGPSIGELWCSILTDRPWHVGSD